MRRIIVKIRVPLGPFLKLADELIDQHGYQNEDRIKVAMHQSVIRQDEAFQKALELIDYSPGYNVAVEPMELDQEKNTITYHATYVLPLPHEVSQDESILNPVKFLEKLKQKFSPEDYMPG